MATEQHGFKVCSLFTLFHNTLYNKQGTINGRKKWHNCCFPHLEWDTNIWYVFAICTCNNTVENKVFFLFCVLWVLSLGLRVSNFYLSSHNFQVQKYFLHISTHTFHSRCKFTNFLNECEQFEMQVGTPLSLHFIQQLYAEIMVFVLVVQPCQLYMPNNCL